MSINFKCRQIYAGLVIYLAILLFALNVHAGNVTLSWTSPSYNEDGSDFVDLAGYNIYYGTTSNIYTNIIHVDNVTTYQITNLTEGITYYFVITVYNTSGNESGYSSEESITISTSAVPAPEITVTDSVAPVTDYHVPFGNITEGHSSTQTVTLTNDGNADLLIGNIAHYIPTGPGFSILADYCSGQTLSPSLNCTFRVRFSPTAEGEFNDSFDIPSSDSAKSPVIITLAGTGVPSSVPAMQVTDSVSPANDLHIPFGSIAYGLSSASERITISNTGTDSLSINGINVSAEYSNTYTIDAVSGNRSCGSTAFSLYAGSSCIVDITFRPVKKGPQYANIIISSNDPDGNSLNIALSGKGVSSDFNNSPSEPDLIYPKNNQKNIGKKSNFRWKKSQDPDNDNLTYTLSVCTDENFSTGCITQDSLAALPDNTKIYYAGIGSPWMVILLIVTVMMSFGNSLHKKRKSVLLLIAIIMTAVLLVSCGSDSDSSSAGVSSNTSSNPDEISVTASGLESSSTYYWKVQVSDDKGGTTDSHIWTFETE
ncbi:MAG: choice-of-anchor D domain-containing protein [Nitrospirota bacterium]